MNDGKWMGMLSLCRKAGRLKIGAQPVKESIEAGEARLILFASDFSPRSRERMEKALAKSGDPPGSRTVEAAMADLAKVCGKQAGVVAVTDEGFAAGLSRLLSGQTKADKGIVPGDTGLLCDQTKEEQNR